MWSRVELCCSCLCLFGDKRQECENMRDNREYKHIIFSEDERNSSVWGGLDFPD